MDIVLYNTISKRNTVGKVKTTIKTVTGTSLEPFSVMSTVVTIKRDDAILNANYCYIAKFSRYYFIKDVVFKGGMMELSLEVDVLESYKDEILAYNGIIERQEYDYNLDLEDSEVSAYSDVLVQYRKFPATPFKANVVDGELAFVLITTSD